MDNYANLLFTEAVQAEQDRAGTRERYVHAYRNRHRGPLDEDARAFLQTRTSFYMASISSSGWPYVQHRGGPAGFIKVLGPEQIGFADYRGNQQFISMGNMATETWVSLFFMDYPRRGRLKMQGHARMIRAEDDPETAQLLATPGEGPVERLAVIDIVAMDWNCPKYIEPRFTEGEIEAMIGPRFHALAEENAALKARIAELEAKGA